MINFNTDNIFIACYPYYGGGKFLLNCLGLSDDAVFQDSDLAYQQLAGNFTINDKIAYIRTEIANTVDIWSDLNLGCIQLLGVDVDDILSPTVTFNPIIENLSTGNKKFFVVAHTLKNLEMYLTRWPNAKLIVFKNNRKFLEYRAPDKFDLNILNYYERKMSAYKSTVTWNTDWYFSRDDTVNNVEQIYKHLNLTNFNRSYVEEYYDLWTTKLNELKK